MVEFRQLWNLVFGKKSRTGRLRRPAKMILEALEERTVPATVSIAAVQNGSEMGINGVFRVSRSDTDGNLSVNYSLNPTSTASNGADFTLSGSVTIPDGSSFTDIIVVPVDDSEFESPETVILDLISAASDKIGSSYTIGSPGSATLTISDNDAYPVYVAAVAAADQEYAEAVLAAATARNNAIETARLAARADAEELYATYLAVHEGYAEEVAAAEDAYFNAVLDADAAAQSAYATAAEIYEAAAGSAESALATAMAAALEDYQDALTAAANTYESAVEPYQVARDQAYANYLANPNDPGAEEAWDEAEANLAAAIASASADRSAAEGIALAAYDAGQQDNDQDYLAALSSAYGTFQTAVAAVHQTWANAEDAAWAIYLTAKANADANYVADEELAWDNYEAALVTRETTLEAQETLIESQFTVAVNAARAAWEDQEEEAWGAYLAALAANPIPPPQQPRITAPAEVEPPPVPPFDGLPQQPRVMPVMLAQAAPEDIADLPRQVFQNVDFFRTHVKPRVMQNIARTNHGVNGNGFDPGTEGTLLADSGQQGNLDRLVAVAEARLRRAGGRGTTTATSAVATSIEYNVQNYNQPVRSGYADVRVFFRRTITATFPNGTTRTVTVEVRGGARIYDEGLRTRSGLVAGPGG